MTPPPSLQDLIETVRQDTTTDSALDQLMTAANTVAQLEDTGDALLGHFVDRCRREGRSWSEISAALGVTKQAVHKRFATTMADQIIAAVPAPTLQRFTTRARSVLAAARREAQAAGDTQVSSVHILLALCTEPDGLAAKALQATGVEQTAVQAAIQAAAPAAASQAEPAQGAPEAGESATRFGPDARLALRDAVAVALELGHNYIGTEHLLLALFRAAHSPAAAVLASAGAAEAAIREHILAQLRGFQPGVN